MVLKIKVLKNNINIINNYTAPNLLEETLKKKAQIDAAAVLLTKEAEIKCLEDELRKIQGEQYSMIYII